jgi:hypothetical protein
MRIAADEANPHYFTVLLDLSDLVIGKEQQEVDRQMEIAHALIRLEKPAHTRYKFEPIFPTFRIGSQAQGTKYCTQVEKNTRIGVAEWR